MPRLIEIAMFLAPFLAFAMWRLVAPAPLPPLWLIGSLTSFVILMLLTLIWLRYTEAENANRPYIPATLQNGRVIPGHAGTPR